MGKSVDGQHVVDVQSYGNSAGLQGLVERMSCRENQPEKLRMCIKIPRRRYHTESFGHGTGGNRVATFVAQQKSKGCSLINHGDLHNTHLNASALSLTLEIRPRAYSSPDIRSWLGGGNR